ncbi:exodeoxyribonuclease V beta subunit [Rhodococcus triatomae]|uniref:RecBCD enzyme subunit RecB n=1 Tax=Rhodococcus triatomae TaxID=300028 RepID=A0A1G8BBU6_9NOCA|nr:UvrD-helicase domain-containing protein [Rhodococcus triatomae]SDH30648.1 exodeoxyribonuclease V beta subunit [Rhodococcus triatomae]
MSFDLLGPLPTGTTVLEASAGTGKTYTIVGLATRYVAEGHADVADLLLVTFSRAATQELRERTRERFTVTAAALADPDAARSGSDPLARLLADADAETVEQRRRRLVQALADFDAGTIVTTHSFCQRMLDGLGIAGESDADVTLVESVDDLAVEAADDVYLQAYARRDGPPPFAPRDARELARAVVRDRQAVLAPDADTETAAGHRVAFSRAVREEVARRKRLAGVRDFDDLLVLLHGVLTDPDHGESACRRVRDHYRIVLVDEFQDTDPLQWDIIRRAFHGARTLVLVGDPKQAIYAFRGAEVLSYLDAVRHADRHEDLAMNWRSDAPLIEALEHLYGGAALGHPDITVRPVEANHSERRLNPAAGEPDAPLRLRYLTRTGLGPLGKTGFPAVGAVRRRVAEDLAADVVGLLDGRASLTGGPAGPRPVAPGDVAILVRTRAQIDLVREALDEVGVPSVLAGGASVFATESATHWLWVLQALEQPHRGDRVRLAALTPVLGWSPERLDSEAEDAVGRMAGWLRELSAIFHRTGFAAVYERISAETGLEQRLLSVTSGERALTDIRHLAQLFGRAAAEESMGLAELTRWLTERIEDPIAGGGADRSRRLDSDADAVQIATVHASKGLEFPIVYLPFAWDAAKNPYPATRLLHDDEGRRILDVGGRDGPGYRDRGRRADAEESGEELRLLYVAATRARSRLVAWWAPAASTSRAPLHRLIFGREPGVAEPVEVAKVPEDAHAVHRLEAWPAQAAAVISVEPASAARVQRYTRGGTPVTDLAVATFARTLDLVWRRTSYSALTSSAHEQAVATTGSESEDPGITDEPEDSVSAALVPEPEAGLLSPMNDFPGGTEFGTLVHEVLEHVDTGTGDLRGELVRACRDAVAAQLADLDPDALAGALHTVMHTPMGETTLADVAPRDLLPELEFEIPLSGGDTPVPDAVTLADIAASMRRHLSVDDPLRDYPALLETVEAPPLRGFLTGSIDAVIRADGPRYVVVDYKTNRLGTGDLTTAHYTRERMAQAMMQSHYPLQALLYAAALHRYLRWRQPEYDPDRHLGGVCYLFVRGMVGPDTPAGCGVFDWCPPAALVTELSELLAGKGVS